MADENKEVRDEAVEAFLKSVMASSTTSVVETKPAEAPVTAPEPPVVSAPAPVAAVPPPPTPVLVVAPAPAPVPPAPAAGMASVAGAKPGAKAPLGAPAAKKPFMPVGKSSSGMKTVVMGTPPPKPVAPKVLPTPAQAGTKMPPAPAPVSSAAASQMVQPVSDADEDVMVVQAASVKEVSEAPSDSVKGPEKEPARPAPKPTPTIVKTSPPAPAAAPKGNSPLLVLALGLNVILLVFMLIILVLLAGLKQSVVKQEKVIAELKRSTEKTAEEVVLARKEAQTKFGVFQDAKKGLQGVLLDGNKPTTRKFFDIKTD